MATGGYSCSSNRAKVTDPVAVRKLLTEYETHRQVSFDGTYVSVDSSSDTFKVDDDEGNTADEEFLERLSDHLSEKLVITNVMNPPREAQSKGKWHVDPDRGVHYAS